ncbi:uncharacterized protein LOC133291071 [Gastrolobium bilobum]|uniref:uncharacterized protein LOC133291071 n=1 Tax=Gastrolobium bilobum TaxID=150636 RepID=UPI002AB13ECD|nr:uncharacterized protein LOC133291071 [Gastrolobium bilobum]
MVDLIVLEGMNLHIILGMDWLVRYGVMLDCCSRRVFFAAKGEKPDSLYLTTQKLNKALNEGDAGYIILGGLVGDSKEPTANIPVVCEFEDVFPEEIPHFPPEREIEFSIDLVPGVGPISLAPYRMSPVELAELKKQLEELSRKNFIRPSVSPWGAPVIFVKKKDGTMRKTTGVASMMITEYDLIEEFRDLRISVTPFETSYFMTTVEVRNSLMEKVKAAQVLDERIQMMKEKDFVFTDASHVKYYKDRLIVPKGPMVEEVLTEGHMGKYTIHPGATKMHQDLKQNFWWSGMKKDIAQFVNKCLICQKVKIEHQKPSGLLQPLDIPEWKWMSISMDFVVGLPRSQAGFDSIWVVVDRLTKSAHFIPVKTTFSTEQLAKLYVREIVKLHGIPKSIVSDGIRSLLHAFGKRYMRPLVLN